MTPPTYAPASFFRPLPRLRTWRLLGALAIVLTIVLSLVPMPPSPVHVEGGDKIEHLLGYFGLAAWHVQLVANARALAWCALGLVLLGAGIEVAQGFTTWREADWSDLGANLAGVAAGSALYATPLRHVLARFDRPRTP